MTSEPEAKELTDNNDIIINELSMTNGGGSIMIERMSRKARELSIGMLMIFMLIMMNMVVDGGGHFVHFDENLKRLWRWI